MERAIAFDGGVLHACQSAGCTSTVNGNFASVPQSVVAHWGRSKMSTRDVAEVSKLQEITKLLESLKEAAHQLPEDTDRRDALRKIRDFQLRVAALVHRLAFPRHFVGD
jgi:hypothetical protein